MKPIFHTSFLNFAVSLFFFLPTFSPVNVGEVRGRSLKYLARGVLFFLPTVASEGRSDRSLRQRDVHVALSLLPCTFSCNTTWLLPRAAGSFFSLNKTLTHLQQRQVGAGAHRGGPLVGYRPPLLPQAFVLKYSG